MKFHKLITFAFVMTTMHQPLHAQDDIMPICKPPAPVCSIFKRPVCEWTDSGGTMWVCRGFFEPGNSGKRPQPQLDLGGKRQFDPEEQEILIGSVNYEAPESKEVASKDDYDVPSETYAIPTSGEGLRSESEYNVVLGTYEFPENSGKGNPIQQSAESGEESGTYFNPVRLDKEGPAQEDSEPNLLTATRKSSSIEPQSESELNVQLGTLTYPVGSGKGSPIQPSTEDNAKLATYSNPVPSSNKGQAQGDSDPILHIGTHKSSGKGPQSESEVDIRLGTITYPVGSGKESTIQPNVESSAALGVQTNSAPSSKKGPPVEEPKPNLKVEKLKYPQSNVAFQLHNPQPESLLPLVIESGSNAQVGTDPHGIGSSGNGELPKATLDLNVKHIVAKVDAATSGKDESAQLGGIEPSAPVESYTGLNESGRSKDIHNNPMPSQNALQSPSNKKSSTIKAETESSDELKGRMQRVGGTNNSTEVNQEKSESKVPKRLKAAGKNKKDTPTGDSAYNLQTGEHDYPVQSGNIQEIPPTIPKERSRIHDQPDLDIDHKESDVANGPLLAVLGATPSLKISDDTSASDPMLVRQSGHDTTANKYLPRSEELHGQRDVSGEVSSTIPNDDPTYSKRGNSDSPSSFSDQQAIIEDSGESTVQSNASNLKYDSKLTHSPEHSTDKEGDYIQENRLRVNALADVGAALSEHSVSRGSPPVSGQYQYQTGSQTNSFPQLTQFNSGFGYPYQGMGYNAGYRSLAALPKNVQLPSSGSRMYAWPTMNVGLNGYGPQWFRGYTSPQLNSNGVSRPRNLVPTAHQHQKGSQIASAALNKTASPFYGGLFSQVDKYDGSKSSRNAEPSTTPQQCPLCSGLESAVGDGSVCGLLTPIVINFIKNIQDVFRNKWNTGN